MKVNLHFYFQRILYTEVMQLNFLHLNYINQIICGKKKYKTMKNKYWCFKSQCKKKKVKKQVKKVSVKKFRFNKIECQ